jgi:hemerythrin-like metal-binding protein
MNNSNHDEAWNRWVMQTAKTTRDLEQIIKKTNVQTVDSDHHQWVNYALETNKVVEQLNSGEVDLESIAREGNLFQNLFEYTKEHFKREIRLIQEFELPGIRFQAEQHSRILSLMEDIVRDFQLGRIAVSMKLKVILLNEVISHINNVDYHTFQLKNFETFLNKAESWNDLVEIIVKTGVPEIDEQHKEITEIALEIMKSLRNTGTASPHVLEQQYTLFEAAVRKHFTYEESFLERFKMEGLAQHKEEHRRFLNDLPAKWQQPTGFSLWILNWWIDHIGEKDSALFRIENWASTALTTAISPVEASHFLRKTALPSVDNEHFQFVELVFRFRDCVSEKSDTHNLQSAYREIVDFATKHFTTEENIIEQKKLPGLDNHRLEHAQILHTLNGIQSSFLPNSFDPVAADVFKTKLLSAWFQHINHTDYVTFVDNARRQRRAI